MALKFGTSPVNDVKYKVNSTNKVVTVIQNTGGVVYWARPGVLSIDSTTGVSSVTVTRSAALEPTASTGVLSNGATIYHGDTLKIYPSLQPYWTISSPVTATVNFLATQTFAVSSVLHPDRVTHSVNIKRDSNITSVVASYSNTSGNPTSTSSAASSFWINVWDGGQLVLTPTGATNWTASVSTYNPVGAVPTIQLTASRWPHKITIPALDHAAIAYTYSNVTNGSSTTGSTQSTYVYAWQGHTFSYAWSALSYYSISGTAGGSFTVTQASEIPAATIIHATRPIVISNLDYAARIKVEYKDSTGTLATYTMSTHSQPSHTIDNTWQGGTVTYTYVAIAPPSDAWFSSSTFGTIGPASSTYPVSITATLKTFNFKYYNTGSMTYYSSSSMSTAITQSKYSTSRYYRYTATPGYYVKNGTTYTTILSGVVPASDANIASGLWSAFTTDPVEYCKVHFDIRHRGNTYYKLQDDSSYSLVAPNTPGTTTADIYVPRNSTIYVYASYVAAANSSTGLASSTYGSASDNYVSGSSPYSTTISAATTFTFSGSLTARTVTINQERAAHGTGVTVTYRNLNNTVTTIQNLTINKLTPTDVWSGATITLTSAGTFVPSTGWSMSGYNYEEPCGTSNVDHEVLATYGYATQSKSTLVASSGTSLATTLNASSFAGTTPSVYVAGRHGAYNVKAWMASTATRATGTSTNASITAVRSSSTTITATLTGRSTAAPRSITITAVSSFIAPPAIRYYQSDSEHCFDGVVVYNPNTYAMNINGQVDIVTEDENDYEVATIDFAGGESISSASAATYPYPNEIEPTVGGEITADISVCSRYTTSWSSASTSYYEAFTMP